MNIYMILYLNYIVVKNSIFTFTKKKLVYLHMWKTNVNYINLNGLIVNILNSQSKNNLSKKNTDSSHIILDSSYFNILHGQFLDILTFCQGYFQTLPNYFLFLLQCEVKTWIVQNYRGAICISLFIERPFPELAHIIREIIWGIDPI